MAEEIHTTEAFRYHWKVWQWSGFTTPPRGSPWRIPYIVYSLLFHLSVNVTALTSLIVNCCLSQSIADLCSNFYMTTTDLSVCLKLINVYWTRHELEKVHLILKDLDLRAVTTEERSALRDGINSAKKCFVGLMALFFLGLGISQLVVLLSEERVLIFPAWLPWDWKSSLGGFLLANIFQCLTFYIQATQDIANDTYPQAYLRILVAHMRALAIRIRALGEQSQGSGDACADVQEREYEKLIECIKDHQRIKSLFMTIQKPISRTCFIQFVCTGVAQCTIGIYILYVGSEFARLLLLVMYLICVSLETFLLCYIGEMVCTECSNLENAIYSCNWTGQSQKFKKALLLLLHRTQETCIVKAGGVIPMHLPTFVTVVRVAYSAFTVLNEMK